MSTCIDKSLRGPWAPGLFVVTLYEGCQCRTASRGLAVALPVRLGGRGMDRCQHCPNEAAVGAKALCDVIDDIAFAWFEFEGAAIFPVGRRHHAHAEDAFDTGLRSGRVEVRGGQLPGDLEAARQRMGERIGA